MKEWFRYVQRLVLVFLGCVALVAGGCDETDTRNKVDDTVEEMAGKKNLDRYKQMKDDLGEIQTQQTKKYRQLKEDADEK
ncbi:hypothetical protein [Desulfosarcina sp.]|uniref:hypothetical protein n=1 Tax=Desulfosarcina sp. TaxID=2027861 RepID=UPI0029AA08C7|nr:hypothetical protein [Desulfosarcina sp.]MDX2454248.1 hypothetical protein [Desulfosarcina sp.]MDX2491915.1 hypothetical protein [Desulfosarcina sp.]